METIASAQEPLQTREGVVTLMKSSRSEEDWNDNCDTVKKANGGYPNFWFEEILQSGVANAILSSFRL